MRKNTTEKEMYDYTLSLFNQMQTKVTQAITIAIALTGAACAVIKILYTETYILPVVVLAITTILCFTTTIVSLYLLITDRIALPPSMYIANEHKILPDKFCPYEKGDKHTIRERYEIAQQENTKTIMKMHESLTNLAIALIVEATMIMCVCVFYFFISPILG